MKVKLLFNKTKGWAEKTALEAERIIEKKHELVKKNADATIVVGGDGTILHYKEQIEGKLIGIGSKTSHMCHLSHFELDDKLMHYLNKKETHEIRLIECLCNGKRLLALNDVFIASSNHAVVKIRAEALHYREEAICDGLIISTPFGSTGYNKSAGGPVLGLGIEALALAWSNPTIYKSAFVIPYSNISAKIKEGPADLIIDGKKAFSGIELVKILPSARKISYVLKN